MQDALPHQGLIDVLHKCRHSKNLHEAKRLHAFLRRSCLDSHPVIGNYLVPMLVDCGCLQDAHHAFDRLLHPNAHSWTSLIAGYLESDDPQLAFHLYHRMQEGHRSGQPNKFTFLALLTGCARLRNGDRGRELHMHLLQRGLDTELYLGSALVDMYTKCGSLAEAHQVLDALPARDAISWNGLIAGYAEYGLGIEVLNFFEQMQLESVPATAVTFLCTLKACGIIKALETGKGMFDEVTKRGWERDVSMSSTLVDMYMKCGLVAEAEQLFRKLTVKNAISWNVLITAYAEHGLCEEAESCFHKMQLEGISPDSVTFICSLKACGSKGALETGHKIHTQLIKTGIEKELYVGNTLVDMYTKCSSIADAQQVFDWLPIKDSISWNALIPGYTDQHLDEEVLTCFHRMQMGGVHADHVTYVCSLKACGSIGALRMGREIHAEVVKRGLENESYMGSTLVNMYGKCGSPTEAHQVFKRLPVRHAVAWTALIAGYSEHDLHEEVLNCFKQMQLEDVSLDIVTCILCLKACGAVGALEIGQEIHAKIRKVGLEANPSVGSMLVDMYGKCGSVAEGWEIFHRLPVRDVVSWTAMIKAYGENHEVQMAVKCFEQMQEQGVKPDSITFTCVLAACSHGSLVLKGQEYFKLMKEHYEIQPTLDQYCCMVDLFARAGLICEAERFLTAMQCPVSNEILKALLSACKSYGKVKLGERYFRQLVEVNQEDASACLLMEEIYTNAGRWNDSNRVGEMRKFAGKKKKPGSAVIEVNKLLYEFVVSTNQSDDILEISESLGLCIKDGGYIPSLELILSPVSEIHSETTLCNNFVDSYSAQLTDQVACLTGDNGYIR